MIPYDDLVGALANWRARQGLPVAELSATPIEAPRATPPPPPPAFETGGGDEYAMEESVPPPAAEGELAVDDAALLETHYDNEGDDFAMAFSNLEANGGEATTIGAPPPPHPRDSFSGGTTEPGPMEMPEGGDAPAEPLPDAPYDPNDPDDPRNRNDW